MSRNVALDAEKSAATGPRAGSVSMWARLIQRVYEVDPPACPQSGGVMKIIGFIRGRHRDVIERILRGGKGRRSFPEIAAG